MRFFLEDEEIILWIDPTTKKALGRICHDGECCPVKPEAWGASGVESEEERVALARQCKEMTLVRRYNPKRVNVFKSLQELRALALDNGGEILPKCYICHGELQEDNIVIVPMTNPSATQLKQWEELKNKEDNVHDLDDAEDDTGFDDCDTFGREDS